MFRMPFFFDFFLSLLFSTTDISPQVAKKKPVKSCKKAAKQCGYTPKHREVRVCPQY